MFMAHPILVFGILRLMIFLQLVIVMQILLVIELIEGALLVYVASLESP